MVWLLFFSRRKNLTILVRKKKKKTSCAQFQALEEIVGDLFLRLVRPVHSHVLRKTTTTASTWFAIRTYFAVQSL